MDDRHDGHPDVRDADFDVVSALTGDLIVPTSLSEGETGAFARWIKEPYAAVMCVTRWPNDQFCTDCALLERGSDGSWHEVSSGGGAGPMDPWEKPVDGWGGDPMVWSGSIGSTVGEEEGALGLQVVEGMAAAPVASIDVVGPDGEVYDHVEVSPLTNLVIVGLLGPGPYTMIARGEDGEVLSDAQGYEVRDVIEDDGMPELPFLELLARETDAPVIGTIVTDASGKQLVDSGGGSRAASELEQQLISRFQEWDMRNGLARRIGRDI